MATREYGSSVNNRRESIWLDLQVNVTGYLYFRHMLGYNKINIYNYNYAKCHPISHCLAGALVR